MVHLGLHLRRRALRLPVFALLLAALAAPHALTAQPAPQDDAFGKTVPAIRATGAGEVVVGPDLQSTAEAVTLDPGVAPLLLSLPAESEVRLGDWPIAPEVRADVVLQRHEIYEPKARIFKTVGQRLVEVPRSRLVFYWGEAETDGDVRVFVSVDPESGEIRGFSQSLDGTQELRPQPATPETSGEEPRYLVAPLEAFEAQDKAASPSGGRAWSCGEEQLPQNLAQLNASSWLGKSTVDDKALTSLHSAILAVDTDNEFMSTKFANNTTNATNYIANLIAKMNVFYERDLKVRLLQGTTILRVSTTPDPYNQAAATNADGNKLNEFSNYWNATYGGVVRALAMMLSGKQPNTGASGIAWLGSLCSKSVGYSFSQVFKSAGDTSSSDAGLVGHEIGHNFGSPHTHCYNPPIDTCYNGEAANGCYSGATSCPATTTITNNGVPVTNVKGTLMSYCHLLGGCSASNVFHPRSITEAISPEINSALNICILPVVTSPAVAAITPNNGSTGGGTPVTITGANFVAGATVTIGGVAATGVNVINATTITATTGAHATGTVSIAVTNPDTQSGSLTNGYFYSPPSTASNFYTVTPCRVVDTRNANGPQGGPVLAASAIRTFPVAGVCGIPASAKAISGNITIVTPAAFGSLSTFPGNGIPVGTSAINFSPGQVRANNAVLLLATNGSGSIGVQNGSVGATHFLLDVNGYFQ